MMTSEPETGLRRGLIILSVLAVALLLDAPATQAAGCKQDPDQPKCGDDVAANGEIALITTFNCPGGDCPKSSWQADANGFYSDGDDSVKSRFTSAGGYVLTMHERQNRAGVRKVLWDLGHAGAPTVTLPNGVSFTSTQDLVDDGREHKTVIQVGKFTDVDLRELAPGESVGNVDMLLDLIVYGSKRDGGNSILFVRYGDASTGQCPSDSGSTGVTVRRTDNGVTPPMSWTVTTSMIACLYDFETEYGDYHGDYPFGELTLYLEEK